MPWWGWVALIVLVTLNVIGWFGDDDDDDTDDDDEEDYARLIYDLRTEVAGQAAEISQYKRELAMMEREGVIEGIYEFCECGYWKPTREEAEAFREEYPERVSQDDIDDVYGADNVYVLRGGL
jgi:hypothetical protein